jgi:glycosyltransferase involved in cell wall biosynthesis
MRLSVVLPCYNEEENLSALFERLDKLIERRPGKEIILVNVPINKGYGYGIIEGLKKANGDVLSYTHADRQTDPMDVLKAFDIFVGENNTNLLVKGYRTNRKWVEAFFSYCMAILSSLALGQKLTEINAQPKLFSKVFFDRYLEDAPHDFSLDLYLLYCAKKNGKIIDFPVYFAKRVAGEAKGGGGSSWKVKKKLIKRTLSYIFELRKKLKQDE